MVTLNNTASPAQQRATSKNPLASLLGDLTADASHLFRQEVALAKAEVGEKVSQAARHVAILFAGIFILCNGIIIAMAGLSYGIAQLFLLLGVGRLLANSMGFLFFGALIMASGIAASLYAKNKLMDGSLMPTRTVNQFK
ncbi:phage holin family protein [Roseibacillus persicicus]|uniref:Phage holin family protein n=1 Tax=Roseibacillus persicicus TaxID=454148 RepID=A0A918TIX1_9BACT|nr:phage holin family protein [Roseibacillus persicicus]MDQ8190295.1 phage holin family protein [Roseibacillus persicicus]GHC46977.1 hypothetical protein GCM10007100_10860 [Roseibacillus persicicus]